MINKELIKEYKLNEQQSQKLKDELSVRRIAFDEENKYIFENINVYMNRMEELKQEIKGEGLVEFKQTGKKQLTGGLGIQTKTKLEYNEDEAIEWARTNMAVAVKVKTILDKTMFNSHAKKNPIKFVEIIKDNVVTWPSELKMEEQ